MGFSSTISHMILYIFLIVIIGGMFILVKSVALDNEKSLVIQQNLRQNKVQTSILIINTTWNSTLDQVTSLITNDGKTRIDITKIDIYIDNMRVPRNNSNRTFTVNSPDIINPGLWDPKEQITLVVNKTLSFGSHSIEVKTEYSTSDSDIFDV